MGLQTEIKLTPAESRVIKTELNDSITVPVYTSEQIKQMAVNLFNADVSQIGSFGMETSLETTKTQEFLKTLKSSNIREVTQLAKTTAEICSRPLCMEQETFINRIFRKAKNTAVQTYQNQFSSIFDSLSRISNEINQKIDSVKMFGQIIRSLAVENTQKLIQANFDIEICKEAISMFGSGEIEKQNSNDPIALVIMKQRLRALTEKKEILERMIARNKIDAGLFIMFEIQISRIPKEVIPIWQNITASYVGQLTLSNANELANTILDQTSEAFMNYSNQATANVDSVLKLSKRTILSENDLKKDTANLIETVRKIGQFSTDVATTLEMRQVSTDNFLEAFNTEVSSIEYK